VAIPNHVKCVLSLSSIKFLGQETRQSDSQIYHLIYMIAFSQNGYDGPKAIN